MENEVEKKSALSAEVDDSVPKEAPKVKIEHGPSANEQLYREIAATEMPKEISATVEKRKLKPWLLPLIIMVVFLVGLFVLLPKLVNRETSVPEPVTTTSRGKSGANVGGEAVVAVTVTGVYAAPDLEAERLTELLLNEKVILTNTDNPEWLGVRLADGVNGYVRRSALTADTSSLAMEDCVCKVMVKEPYKRVMSHARDGALLVEAPLGSVLFADYRRDSLLRVKLPGKKHGWISDAGVFLIPAEEHLPVTKNALRDISATAIMFVNKPYMPAGMTSRGINVLGAVRLAARLNGVELPRSIEALRSLGEKVELPTAHDGVVPLHYLQPGDLVFLGSWESPEKAVTLALALPDRRLLLERNNSAVLRDISLDDEEIPELAQHIIEVRRLKISE